MNGPSRRRVIDRHRCHLSLRLLVAFVVATVLTGAGVAASTQETAAASSGPSSVSTISMYPEVDHGGPWEWYRSCLFLPSVKIPPSGGLCQASDPVFGPIVLNGDLWNLDKTASGGVTMQNSTSGALAVSAHFPAAGPKSSSTWVLGYPNVSYGIEPQSAADSPTPSAGLPLPVKLSTVLTVVGTADYAVSGTSTTRFDFAYDMWLEPQKTVETPRAGTLEIMVWMDYANHALPPDYREKFLMDYAVNGSAENGQWFVYLPVGKVRGTTTVVLAVTNPLSRATFAIALTGAIQRAESALHQYDPSEWPSFSDYYLDSISLGSEFGLKEGNSSLGPLSWGLSRYSLGVGSKLP